MVHVPPRPVRGREFGRGAVAEPDLVERLLELLGVRLDQVLVGGSRPIPDGIGGDGVSGIAVGGTGSVCAVLAHAGGCRGRPAGSERADGGRGQSPVRPGRWWLPAGKGEIRKRRKAGRFGGLSGPRGGQGPRRRAAFSRCLFGILRAFRTDGKYTERGLRFGVLSGHPTRPAAPPPCRPSPVPATLAARSDRPCVGGERSLPAVTESR
jgi:hypothetical protein